MTDGRLKKTLEVHCAGCGTAALGLPGHHDSAKAELRRDYRWGTRKGLWYCSECKDKPETWGRYG